MCDISWDINAYDCPQLHTPKSLGFEVTLLRFPEAIVDVGGVGPSFDFDRENVPKPGFKFFRHKDVGVA